MTELLTVFARFLAILLPPSLLFGIAATDVIGMFVSALFLLRTLVTRNAAWIRRPWIIALLILWAVLVMRGMLSEYPDLARSRTFGWVRFPLLAAALATWILPHAATRRRFGWMWSATVAFLLADTAYQYASGVDLFGHLPVPLDDKGHYRLTGPFADPKVGIVLSWLVFPAAGFLAGRVSAVAGWIVWLAALAAIFASGERMAMLNVGFGGLLLWLLTPSMRRSGLVFAAIGLVALAAAAWMRPALLERQLDSTAAAARHVGDSAYGRIWQSGWNVFSDAPVWGVGLRQFREVCPRPEYGDPDDVAVRCNIHPHHFWLEWLVETGISGTLLFIVAIGLAWRELHGTRPDPELYGSEVALLLRLWPLSTAASFFVAWSALPFWLALGWALSIEEDKARC